MERCALGNLHWIFRPADSFVQIERIAEHLFIMSKIAFITGITGQDGSYLTEQLLEKGYSVHGMIRRSSSFNTGRIDHLFNDKEVYGQRLFLHHGDLTDASNLNRLLERTGPDEIYN